MTGKIYFISAPGRIKIGYTQKPEMRLRQLRRDDMEELSVVAIHEGTRHIERKLHDMVRPFCVRGEWFTDCPQVRAVIEDFVSGKLAFDPFGHLPEEDAAPVDAGYGHNRRGIHARAIEEATRLCEEIGIRASRGEPISDLVRAACFLAEHVISQ